MKHNQSKNTASGCSEQQLADQIWDLSYVDPEEMRQRSKKMLDLYMIHNEDEPAERSAVFYTHQAIIEFSNILSKVIDSFAVQSS